MTGHKPITDNDHLHQEIWEILPWYVNKTLEGQELTRVEQHLAVCSACQQEVGRWQAISSAARLTEEAVPLPSPEGFARLMTHIDASETEAQPEDSWWDIVRHKVHSTVSRLHSTPPFVRFALAFEGAMILLLAAVIVWQAQMIPRESFITLSNPGTSPQRGQIRLVLAEDILEKELRHLLTSVKATIVEGPSPLGVYTVDLLGAKTPDAIHATLNELRAHPKVQLAEPITTP